uniref:EXS domain-containing protein n=1 Tax=Macrostomum lignano TaxID=282301 RepID=A0A1I8HEY1_9PLAT
AFDSVLRAALLFVLRAYLLVPLQLVDAVMALYCDTRTAVEFWGDTLAPFLFVLLLDWVLRTAHPSADDGFPLRRRIGRRHRRRRGLAWRCLTARGLGCGKQWSKPSCIQRRDVDADGYSRAAAGLGALRPARADESVGTDALYDRAKLQRPFTILCRRRLHWRS